MGESESKIQSDSDKFQNKKITGSGSTYVGICDRMVKKDLFAEVTPELSQAWADRAECQAEGTARVVN